MFKLLNSLVIISIVIMSFLGCSSDTKSHASEQNSSEIVWNDVIFDFPSSISKTTISKAIPSVDSPDYNVFKMYDGARGYIGLAHQIATNTRTLIEQLYNVQKQINFAQVFWTNPTSNDKISFSVSPSSDYDWRVEIWEYQLSGTTNYLKSADLFYKNPVNGNTKGKVFWDSFASNGTDSVYAMIEFDTTIAETGKLLKISLQGDPSKPDNEPQNVIIECAKKNDIVSVKGNAWIPMMAWTIEGTDHFGDVILGTASRNYVFEAAADAINDHSKIFLALCEATETTNDASIIFDAWSFGNISSSAMAYYISSSRSDLITYMQSMTTYGSPTINSTPSATEVTNWFTWYLSYLESNSLNPEPGLYNLVYMFNLVNPAYFESSLFIGNGDGTTLGIGTIPSWKNNFSISTDIFLASPLSVSNLNVYNMMDHSAPPSK